MSADNALEAAILSAILNGTDLPTRANATGYLALLSSASPDEADPMATEITYTAGAGAYARIPVTKATGWTSIGSSRANVGLIQFAKRTDAGAVVYARSVAWVDSASGAVSWALIATISAELAIAQNIQPQFEAGTITLTAE
jgi:hypothetical protein